LFFFDNQNGEFLDGLLYATEANVGTVKVGSHPSRMKPTFAIRGVGSRNK
jgi:hypothetical protein